LGIPLDAAAVKSKDLDAIQADLAARFAGASDAAAASAEGGMKKLQIALDNTYEAVGYRLLPVLGDYVTVLGDLASKALDAEKSNNGFFEAFVFGFKTVFPMVRAVELLNKVVGNQADELTNARGKQYDYTTINQRMNMGLKELTVTTDENTKSQKKANDAKDKARQKAKAYADTLRERVKTALDNSNDALEKAQGEFDDYKNSLAGAITGLVSLADAVRTQETAESALQESLKDRANAYAALNRLDPTNDAESYAEALDKVAEAEKAVGAAQVARSKADYTKVFRQQIADAQTFSNHLQILAPYLDQFGMAQLINLGPSAGVQVTRDMINGVDGFTVDAYKQSLSSLSASGQALGMSGAGYLFGGNLAGAQNAQGQVNQYSITVNASLVSNPAQVGRDIIEAIKSAERVSGQVFVSV
jgi:tetratricopeptide (TPR) repeat protein